MPARRHDGARLRLTALDPRARPLLGAILAVAPDAVLVGGVVRDACLGRPSGGAFDLDVAVPHRALDIGRRLADRAGGAFYALDPERGAARVVLGAARVDITNWRAPTLAGDLAARDFTVNALAAPLRPLVHDGVVAIIDPNGGLADLAGKRLRPPRSEVLIEDPVRMVRGVRFEATLGFRLTAPTVSVIRGAARRLRTASAERQRDELLALMALPQSGRALRRLDALGLLGVLVPEVEAMRGTTQPRPHRFDVLEHSLRAVEGADRLLAGLAALGEPAEDLAAHLAEDVGGGVDRRRLLRIGALLHDVAKPETRRVVRGRVRFFEHDVRGADRARTIGERLKLPGRAVDVVARLVRHHLRPMHLAQAGALTERARYRFFRDLAEDSRDLLLLVVADAAAVTGMSPLTAWRRSRVVRELMGGWQEQREVIAAPPLLRGEDVMARFRLPPGPAVGALLHRAREAQAVGLVRTREEALAYLARDDEPTGDLDSLRDAL